MKIAKTPHPTPCPHEKLFQQTLVRIGGFLGFRPFLVVPPLPI
ncbi:MAG: hypothetical protein ACK47N_06215 [Microcystis sp.]|nr:hypothetical protein [Microcystis aeruginosa]